MQFCDNMQGYMGWTNPQMPQKCTMIKRHNTIYKVEMNCINIKHMHVTTLPNLTFMKKYTCHDNTVQPFGNNLPSIYTWSLASLAYLVYREN